MTWRCSVAELETGRRRPEALTLVTGLLALVLAVCAFVGELPSIDPRWLLAGGAAFVGMVLLAGSLRGRRE
ncbi:hypothetical protein I4I82_09460 [Pseudonocardia oceani]|uniref:Uncharacterized protein n=1 Tax=Pseudonocardia oceani TaxID=2792013 RepID=A0ABS6U6R0_9PSEU|nr:hypothetical protein [Pseudonocardia oceani]MBW0127915.1 hypothetical protein [Pseudonocardia oceani]